MEELIKEVGFFFFPSCDCVWCYIIYLALDSFLLITHSQFSLERVHNAGAIVNRAKLDWFNSQHFRVKCEHDTKTVVAQLRPLLSATTIDTSDEYLAKIVHLLKVSHQRTKCSFPALFCVLL